MHTMYGKFNKCNFILINQPNILVYVLILTHQHLIYLPMVEQGGTALVFINVFMCI